MAGANAKAGLTNYKPVQEVTHFPMIAATVPAIRAGKEVSPSVDLDALSGLSFLPEVAHRDFSAFEVEFPKLLEEHGDIIFEHMLDDAVPRTPYRESLDPAAAKGKTAGELGLTRCYHSANYGAYQAIVRSPDGRPNVSGPHGFITAISGSRASSGIILIFAVDPSAREGVDFQLAYSGQAIRWLNSEKLRVLSPTPERALSILRDFACKTTHRSPLHSGVVADIVWLV